MYFPDVVALKQFYANPVGILAQRFMMRGLAKLWPDIISGLPSGERMLVVGYGAPFIPAQEKHGNITVMCMPAMQGALYWPPTSENRVTLGDEERLPFAAGTFNRVLIIHALEHGASPGALLREAWRVLAPAGRIIAVVPNRLGWWSHAANSPFGYGRPFSIGQLRDLLDASGLTYLRYESALFAPPASARWLAVCAPALETFGCFSMPRFGGVLLVEAEKQLYTMLRQPVRARAAVPAAIPATKAAMPAFTPRRSPQEQ